MASLSSPDRCELTLCPMTRAHAARTSDKVFDDNSCRLEDNFRIAQRPDVFAVDAHAEWPGAACVRRVQPAQPRHRTGVWFGMSVAARSCTQFPGLFIRKTRGKPVPRFPPVHPWLELHGIPTPLPNLFVEGENSHEAKRRHSFQVRHLKRCAQLNEATGSDQSRYYLSAAPGFAITLG